MPSLAGSLLNFGGHTIFLKLGLHFCFRFSLDAMERQFLEPAQPAPPVLSSHVVADALKEMGGLDSYVPVLVEEA